MSSLAEVMIISLDNCVLILYQNELQS